VNLIKNLSYRIYALAVCFVTLICSAIATGVVLYNFEAIAAPVLTVDSMSYNAHQSIDAFRMSQYYAQGRVGMALVPGRPFLGRGVPMVDIPQTGAEETPAISDEELDELRINSYESVLTGHRRNAIQRTIRSTIVILVSLSLFFIHWRLVKRSNQLDG